VRKLIPYDLQPGMATAEPVFSLDGRQVLVPAGSRLTEQNIRQIQNWQIPFVMVAEEGEAEVIAPPPLPENDPVLAVLPETMVKKTINFANNLEEALYNITDFFEAIRDGGAVDLAACRAISAKVARHLVQPAEAINRLLFRIGAPKDRDYLEHHSVSVAALSGMLAAWMELPPAVVEEVVLAGLLHDIGKIRMPHALIVDSNPTRERQEMLMQHVFLANDLLREVAGLPTMCLPP
jgi:putative nucleotidyltransferase with HDIG domain